jgi:hypothetical protein
MAAGKKFCHISFVKSFVVDNNGMQSIDEIEGVARAIGYSRIIFRQACCTVHGSIIICRRRCGRS